MSENVSLEKIICTYSDGTTKEVNRAALITLDECVNYEKDKSWEVIWEFAGDISGKELINLMYGIMSTCAKVLNTEEGEK